MAGLDLERLTRPISDDAPCGPDLDAAFDPDFHGLMASTAGLLPASFFRPRPDGTGSEAALLKASDREIAAALDRIGELGERTHDLRLIVRQAKFVALCRDLELFAAMMTATAELVDASWADVHPQAEDGNDYFVRVQTVQSLDDTPHVILPLQHAALVEGDRGGSVSYRTWLLATGKLDPRPDETRPDEAGVRRVLENAEIDAIVSRRDQLAAILAAVERIDGVSIERGGYESRIRLEKLSELCSGIAGFLDGVVAARDPSRAHALGDGQALVAADAAALDAGPAAAGVPGPVMGIADRAQAIAHLRGACAYFETYEPSSPAVLFLRLSEQLVGKPFYEVMKLLVPGHAGRAALGVGANAFKLTLEKVAEKVPQPPAAPPATGDVAVPEILTRQKALEAMEAVAAFLRKSEPASPVPLLIARVRDLADRDFASLVNDLFSQQVLKSMREE